ncbi:MAG TPA: ABC transporter permease subunit [Candidatus Limnocylindrales bacterium]|nr:ABC transporter permease subunit [Candidatus Limnocylindrales bacterium]
MRLFASGLRKLFRRLATWLTFALLSGLLALILVAVGGTANRAGASVTQRAAALTLVTFPAAYDAILAFLLGLGGLFAVIYGASIAGSEWTWGTLKNAVARGESRSRYMLLSFASIAAVIAIGLLASFLIGVVAALVGGRLAGVPTTGLDDAETLRRLPEQFLRGAIAIVEEGALGFAIATVARSQLAGIGAGIALYFGEQFATIFLPDIVKYLPFHVANAVVATGSAFEGRGQQAASLDPNTAMLLVGVWLLGSLIVAAVFTERSEIGG